MRVAVVHDYFNQGGGADKVAEAFYLMLPGATMVSTVTVAARLPSRLKNVPIRTTWMQRLPAMAQLYRLYFLLYPLAIETLDMREFDVIVSSSSGYAKGVSKRSGAVHVCYCHNPMRWVWEGEDYIARDGWLKRLNMALSPLLTALRHWDLHASRKPDYYLTNSRYSAGRIERVYGRTCTVVPPPIEVARFSAALDTDDYYLVVARLVSYRRIDTAVQACTELGRKLILIGAGPDHARLAAIAGPTVRFLGWQEDEVVTHHLMRCRALLFTGIEDFGMVAVEAAACGRPTIAFRGGGAVESIVEGETGLFYDVQTAEALAAAIEHFERRNWDRQAIRRHAEGFGPEVFRARVNVFLEQIGVPLHLSRPPLEEMMG